VAATPGVLVEGIVRDCIVGYVRFGEGQALESGLCYDRRKESERFPHAHPPKWSTRLAVVTRDSDCVCGGLLERHHFVLTMFNQLLISCAVK
jgi:hypothetical protein